ncbi:hypothetical protein COU96_01665 [Candidatus Shapirobacteria bacterium CG10_big_fil_rev_8_21_14_0_10_38_14]|uniref:Uncharacterized protein n=1 Tax=Candidatus Shapirobacteria bacterium CG10_big_fil_rev_8_21_14_0_10_38_14 TaxID=1974483 RepID=A0A2M8L5K2_9BACT|nr:MAG: hypothetical protein COU96_01665 [Candidatus Shapirobacteria bacterium CG10_big_fil_rev_8_21_14_0_10_38_14]
MKKSSQAINEDLRKLVIERIKASATDLRISVGSRAYGKQKLLKSVAAGDKLGQQVVKTHLDYLKALASGKVYRG